MNKLTEAQWHQVAEAGEIIMKDGHIAGVEESGEEVLFGHRLNNAGKDNHHTIGVGG